MVGDCVGRIGRRLSVEEEGVEVSGGDEVRNGHGGEEERVVGQNGL
jgi:hypothetical protein